MQFASVPEGSETTTLSMLAICFFGVRPVGQRVGVANAKQEYLMNDRELTPSESAVLVLEEAENLIWALLDDHLEAAETAKLAKLLQENEDVRRRYIECVQLHVDLHDHFAAAGAKSDAAQGAAILPNLMTGGLSSCETPVTE
jgi:hypothetical protein